MKLVIDVSDPKVKLILGNAKHIFESSQLSEELILEIQKFLKKQKLKFLQISKVEVRANINQFSRTRTAVSSANALIYALRLPQKLIKPQYSRSPNITLKKN